MMQIYSFFRLLLRWKDELDKKADAAAKLNVGDAGTGSPGTPSKPTRESKAPQPVQFGGIVPPPEAPQHIPLTNVLPDGAPEAQILKDSTNNLEDVELVQDKPIQM